MEGEFWRGINVIGKTNYSTFAKKTREKARENPVPLKSISIGVSIRDYHSQ